MQTEKMLHMLEGVLFKTLPAQNPFPSWIKGEGDIVRVLISCIIARKRSLPWSAPLRKFFPGVFNGQEEWKVRIWFSRRVLITSNPFASKRTAQHFSSPPFRGKRKRAGWVLCISHGRDTFCKWYSSFPFFCKPKRTKNDKKGKINSFFLLLAFNKILVSWIRERRKPLKKACGLLLWEKPKPRQTVALWTIEGVPRAPRSMVVLSLHLCISSFSTFST